MCDVGRVDMVGYVSSHECAPERGLMMRGLLPGASSALDRGRRRRSGAMIVVTRRGRRGAERMERRCVGQLRRPCGKRRGSPGRAPMCLCAQGVQQVCRASGEAQGIGGPRARARGLRRAASLRCRKALPPRRGGRRPGSRPRGGGRRRRTWRATALSLLALAGGSLGERAVDCAGGCGRLLQAAGIGCVRRSWLQRLSAGSRSEGFEHSHWGVRPTVDAQLPSVDEMRFLGA